MKQFDRIIFCHKPNTHFTYGGITLADNRIREALKALSDDVIDIDLFMINYDVNHITKYMALSRTIYKNYTYESFKKIEEAILPNMNCLLFISHSSYGTLIKAIKKKHKTLYVLTHFHNIEITMAYNRLFKMHMPGGFFELLRDYRSERLVKRYSDGILLLNKRDAEVFKKYYGERRYTIFPITIIDRCPSLEIKPHAGNLKLLFVGTYFWGNVPGLIQFVEQVMPKVDAHLYIVGKDMEKVAKQIPQLENVTIVGRVDDETLDRYYMDSDIVIAPVLTGGGMKTKVAEAMMYGKPVIGTVEAFCGYEFNPKEIGFISDNIADYKQFIDALSKDRELLMQLSEKARSIYERGYSMKRSIEILESLFEEKQ